MCDDCAIDQGYHCPECGACSDAARVNYTVCEVTEEDYADFYDRLSEIIIDDDEDEY